MKVSFTPAAAAFLGAKGAASVTVSSVVISSCCSGPLPPAVKPGAPADTEGFRRLMAEGVTLFYDSLLDDLPELVIDCKDFGSYQEMFVQGWE